MTRDRRDKNRIIMEPLSAQFSGLQVWKSVNLSGRKEQPFYVDEPEYVVLRSKLDCTDIKGLI